MPISPLPLFVLFCFVLQTYGMDPSPFIHSEKSSSHTHTKIHFMNIKKNTTWIQELVPLAISFSLRSREISSEKKRREEERENSCLLLHSLNCQNVWRMGVEFTPWGFCRYMYVYKEPSFLGQHYWLPGNAIMGKLVRSQNWSYKVKGRMYLNCLTKYFPLIGHFSI